MQTPTLALTLLLALTISGLPWPGENGHISGMSGSHPYSGSSLSQTDSNHGGGGTRGGGNNIHNQPLTGTCKETGRPCKALDHQDCPTGTYYHRAAGKCVAGKLDHLDCRNGWTYSHAHNICIQESGSQTHGGGYGTQGGVHLQSGGNSQGHMRRAVEDGEQNSQVEKRGLGDGQDVEA